MSLGIKLPNFSKSLLKIYRWTLIIKWLGKCGFLPASSNVTLEVTHSCFEQRSVVSVSSEQSIQMILEPSGVEPQLSQETVLEEKNVHNGEYRQDIGFRSGDVREPDCF